MLIFISSIFSFSAFGQGQYVFFTPSIDSICHNTLDFIRIKQLLMSQQFEVNQDIQQIENTITILNRHLDETLNEQKSIENELAAINRHIDSLTPKRPNGPRP